VETKVKEIEDISLIGQFVSSLFPKLPVSLIHGGEQIPVKILDTSRQGIVIRSTGIPPQERVLTFTNSGSLYNFFFKMSEKSNEDLEYLIPHKMIIYPSVSRLIERKALNTSEKNEIFISSLTLANEVVSKIAFDPKWTSTIHDHIKILKAIFSNIEFISAMQSDPRVKLLKLTGKPFRTQSVATLSMKQVFSEKKEMESFLEPNEWETIKENEFLFPVNFRNKVFLGAIRIEAGSELELEQYNLIVQTLQSIAKSLHTREDTFYHKGKLTIEDISLKGIGFYLPKKGSTQLLAPGTKVLLELTVSKGLMAFLEATVRNLREEGENTIRMGCEFVNLSPEEKIFLENFLPTK
jgi:hypothetical protein